MKIYRKNLSNSVFSVVIILFIITVTACQENEEVVEEIESREVGYPGVEEELWVYFDRFEEEAFNRGVSINLRAANITGQINEIDESRVLGQCSFGFGRANPNRITIDETFWDRSGERGREFVIFHELGHCFLNRAHREDTDRRGVCLSIMRSGTGTCRDSYSQFTRAQYLDELFNTEFTNDIFSQ
ncbi:hypothetical protein [Tunicatimonas pelagia]|uniref:hypothetical protein n=1 Tax=Tunicatimonas pelagia TaxID=931531 RepID=UPI002666EC76|nr:hypothetical protein [Tunicatimonas pelagia]WKN42873.1 hypothetical protein P0M28_27940 [Tunicatimonas pelagia]